MTVRPRRPALYIAEAVNKRFYGPKFGKMLPAPAAVMLCDLQLTDQSHHNEGDM